MALQLFYSALFRRQNFLFSVKWYNKKMIKVAIIEDETKEREKLRSYFEMLEKENGMPYLLSLEINSFSIFIMACMTLF